MRLYRTEKIDERQLNEVICNICGEKIVKDRFGYFEDHIHLEKQWGYFSNYDGEEHTIDICIACYDKMLQQMKLSPIKTP